MRVYRTDAAIFDAWCREHGERASPASPETVMGFLAAQASRGVKASTLGRRCAAIGYAHRLAGHPDPMQSEPVRQLMRGIRRGLVTAPRGKSPTTAEILTAMLAHIPPTLTGKRDRAILVLGFSGGLRRSELVGLNVEDLRHLKPVAAVREWLAAAGITEGPVFRPINRAGRVRGDARLTDRSVADIVKWYAALAGLEARDFSRASLRASFLARGGPAVPTGSLVTA
jgi:site-specific recombinase XerD